MTATAVDFSYRYPYASTAELLDGAGRLHLATSGGGTAGPALSPFFFQGQLTEPAKAAPLLLAVAKVAQTRFYTPPAMVQRILREADPVVTSGGDHLRFEAFSLCCGVYARADLLPSALVGQVTGRGTTNVDFNPPFRAALSQIKKGDRVALNVGREGLELTRDCGSVEERKVKLPKRWLKGFVEAQSYGRDLALRHEIPAPEARRFLASLSANVKAKDRCALVVAGRQLRLSQRPNPEALTVGGIGRLKLLEPLARQAQSLRIYASPEHFVTAWVLDFGSARFELLLSPEAGRGFSGEGQVLTALVTDDGTTALARMRAALAWQATLSPTALAQQIEATPSAIDTALASLGSQGLVGYDLSEGAYFHREMPFDLSAVVKLHPRLQGAETLVEAGAVEIVNQSAGIETKVQVEAYVRSGDLEHRVVLDGRDHRCSCPWYNRTAGASGPCKHVLAVQMHCQAHAAKPGSS